MGRLTVKYLQLSSLLIWRIHNIETLEVGGIFPEVVGKRLYHSRVILNICENEAELSEKVVFQVIK